MRFEQFVEFFEIGAVEGDDGLCFEDALVFMQLVARRKGPEETGQSFNVATLLEHFAHARHLLLREAKRLQSTSSCTAAAGSDGRRYS